MALPEPAVDGSWPETVRDEATELLQGLIRNRCVNDGTPDSGGETANARLLSDFLSGAGLEVELVEARPGRGSLIATLSGRDRAGLVYLGHTDVVDADATGWQVPPFSGALRDGIVWGRGAVDMLGMTATMATALRHLALSGFRPRADLTVVAVADEEAGGRWGAGWLARTRPELFRGRSVITESGGFPIHTADGVKLECFIGEKGALAGTVTVRGAAGHAAFPYGVDSAIARLPEVIERLGRYLPPPIIDPIWLEYVAGLGLSPEVTADLSDPDRFDAALAGIPPGLARHFHAVTRTTLAATMIRGGTKRNVLPDRVELQLDIRVAPGETRQAVEGAIRALFDGLDFVDVAFKGWRAGSQSARGTPLWAALEQSSARLAPGATLVPGITAATTDGRHVRPLGAPCYGFGLFSDRIAADDYFRMFHSTDERIDQDSLVLLCRLWRQVAMTMLADGQAAATASPDSAGYPRPAGRRDPAR